MPTLLLDRQAIKALIRMVNVINVVEEAFRMCGEGKAKKPAKRVYPLSMVISTRCLLLCRDVRL